MISALGKNYPLNVNLKITVFRQKPDYVIGIFSSDFFIFVRDNGTYIYTEEIKRECLHLWLDG